jgi:hypothetical protein
VVKEKKGKTPDQLAEEVIEQGVANIDEAIEEVDKKLKRYAKLQESKVKLLAARRALLGHGPRTTGGTTTRLTVDDVYAYVKENPGCTPQQISERFEVAGSTARSHLSRNPGRFLSKDGRYWARDPEAGLNTVEDIEEDDE